MRCLEYDQQQMSESQRAKLCKAFAKGDMRAMTEYFARIVSKTSLANRFQSVDVPPIPCEKETDSALRVSITGEIQSVSVSESDQSVAVGHISIGVPSGGLQPPKEATLSGPEVNSVTQVVEDIVDNPQEHEQLDLRVPNEDLLRGAAAMVADVLVLAKLPPPRGRNVRKAMTGWCWRKGCSSTKACTRHRELRDVRAFGDVIHV